MSATTAQSWRMPQTEEGKSMCTLAQLCPEDKQRLGKVFMQLSTLTRQAKESAQKLQQSEQRCVELKNQLASCIDQNRRLAQSNEAMKAEHGQLRTQLQRAKAELTSLLSEHMRQLQVERQERSKVDSQAQSELDRQRNQTETLRSQLQRSEAELRQVKAERDRQLTSNSRGSQDEQLRSRLQRTEAELRQVKAERHQRARLDSQTQTEQRNEVETLRSRLQQSEAELRQVKAERAQQFPQNVQGYGGVERSHVDALHSQLERSEAEVRQLKGERDQQFTRNYQGVERSHDEMLRSRLQRSEAEVRQLKAELDQRARLDSQTQRVFGHQRSQTDVLRAQPTQVTHSMAHSLHSPAPATHRVPSPHTLNTQRTSHSGPVLAELRAAIRSGSQYLRHSQRRPQHSQGRQSQAPPSSQRRNIRPSQSPLPSFPAVRVLLTPSQEAARLNLSTAAELNGQPDFVAHAKRSQHLSRQLAAQGCAPGTVQNWSTEPFGNSLFATLGQMNLNEAV